MSELGRRASEIRELYEGEGIRLHSQSGMAELINGAMELASNSGPHGTEGNIYLGLHLDRVYKAVVPLKQHPNRSEYLKKLRAGNLRFLNRTPSKARDCLFELEIWRSINDLRKNAGSLSEPDVVLDLPSLKIGIACKKIYSTHNVEKTLSNAVKQIRSNCQGFGVVAFSIEDIFPEGKAVGAKTFDGASDFLSRQCQNFLAEHEKLFIKYFKGSDIVGALAVASSIVETTQERLRYSNMQQWFLWSAPELNKNAQISVIHFRNLLGKNASEK